MTMPEERTRSLRWTREFLMHVAGDMRLELSMRESAQEILKTYPTMAAIHARVAVNDGWLAPDPKSESVGRSDVCG